MKLISKFTANQIAEQMANDTIGKVISDKKTELNEFVIDLCQREIKKEIIALRDRYPMYIASSERIQVRSDVGTLEFYDVGVKFPMKAGGYLVSIIAHTSTFEILKKMRMEIDSLEQRKNTMIRQIETTLVSLRTPKKIKEQFPEAYELLDPIIGTESITSIALPINDIRNLLTEYKCTPNNNS